MSASLPRSSAPGWWSTPPCARRPPRPRRDSAGRAARRPHAAAGAASLRLWLRAGAACCARPGSALLASAAVVAALAVMRRRSLRHARQRCGTARRTSPPASGCGCSDVSVEGRAQHAASRCCAPRSASRRGDPILGFIRSRARERIETHRLGRARHGRAPAARHHRGAAGGAPAVRDLAARRQIRADRPRRPGRRRPRMSAPSASLPLVVGPGAPDRAAALMDALRRAARRCRRASSPRSASASGAGTCACDNGTDVLLPEGAGGRGDGPAGRAAGEQALLDRPLAAIDLRLPDRLVRAPAADPAPRSAPSKPAEPQNAD